MKTSLKYTCLLLCGLLILTACSPSKNMERDKQLYIDEFKLFYFKMCLESGFDNQEIKILNSIDKSGMTDMPLGLHTYKMIDSLTVTSVFRMVSKEGEGAEGAAGKHVYSECLSTYNSKWLDSVANAEYKKFTGK